MRKLLIITSIIGALSMTSCDDEKVLAANDYPNEIKSYVDVNYDNAKIMQVIKEKEGMSNEYKVILDNGTTLKFNGNYQITDVEGGVNPKANITTNAGNGTNIANNKLVLPAASYPSSIVDHIKAKHQNQQIVLLIEETDNGVKEYEAILANGEKVEFDQNHNMVKAEKLDADEKIIAMNDYAAPIKEYVNREYPNQKIALVIQEKDNNKDEYNVLLDNGTKLKFNQEYQLIKQETL